MSQFSGTSSDDEEESELREMVELGNIEKVEECIKNGDDVNEVTKNGESLLYAALFIQEETVRNNMIAYLRDTKKVVPCRFFLSTFKSFDKLPEAASKPTQ